MFWPVNKALIWADVWELALPWWTMIRLLLLIFRISPKTLGKKIVVYYSELTMLRFSSGRVATSLVLPMKRVTICFEVLLPQTTFGGFGSGSTVRLMLSVGLIRIDSWFVNCLLRRRHRIFPTFPYINLYTSFLWAFVKLRGIQREQIFFTARCSSNIECMLVGTMPKHGSM